MRIERIELVLLKLPYVHFFETSLGREDERVFIIVRVFSGGLCGFGEVVASENPFYSYETNTTAWHILKDFLIPLVFERSLSSPLEYSQAARKIRGHSMAKAGLELALWDLEAKGKNLPLSRIYGGSRSEILSGVSVGIQDSVPELLDRIQAFLEEGYRRVKIKVKPGWDVDVCRQVRERFPDIDLQADANGAYSLKDIEHLKKLDEFGLLMLEQPFPPYDLWDHSRLQREIQTPVCLDESIISEDTVRKALEMESCRVVNIKVGRVGGIVEARRIHDCCERRAVPVWCGGMLESGIGRAHNLHLASLPNFRLANDLSASRRYYAQDLVEPPIELTARGTIEVPTAPGIGVFPVEERIKQAALKQEVFEPR